MVGRAGFELFWLTNKWVGLGWLTKWPTHGGPGWVTRFDSSSLLGPWEKNLKPIRPIVVFMLHVLLYSYEHASSD